MRALVTTGLFAAALLTASLAAEAAGQALEPLPRDIEMRLALSAAPEHWRDGATVYALDPRSGFKLARQGDNGSACIVGRTSWRNAYYRNDILIPICFDRAGVDTILPVHFEVEELRAKGASAQEVHQIISANYASGKYQAPARAGVSPMLSPILVVHGSTDAEESVLLNYPHLMFYAPGVNMEDIGSRQRGDPTYPWVNEPGLHGYIIQPMGETEKAQINQSQKDLTDALCALNSGWCLD